MSTSPGRLPRPARPATCTMVCARRSGGAKVGAEEALVGVQHDDQRDVRKVMALGDHLRADQDARIARGHALDDRFHDRRGLRTTSRSSRTSGACREEFAQHLLDTLGALAHGFHRETALRAALRQRRIGAAVMAAQPRGAWCTVRRASHSRHGAIQPQAVHSSVGA